MNLKLQNRQTILDNTKVFRILYYKFTSEKMRSQEINFKWTSPTIFKGRVQVANLEEEEMDPWHVSQIILSQLLDYEIDSYGEPDKYDSLDESCQIKDPDVQPESKTLPEIQGPPEL